MTQVHGVSLFNDAARTSDYVTSNGRMREEVVVAYSKVFCGDLTGGTDENHEKNLCQSNEPPS
jgi:hypothetical protein